MALGHDMRPDCLEQNVIISVDLFVDWKGSRCTGHRKGNSRHAQDPASRVQALHTVNKLLTVLLLERRCVEPCCVHLGRRFREDKAVRLSYSKTQFMRILPYYVMFNHHVRDTTSCIGAWSNVLSSNAFKRQKTYTHVCTVWIPTCYLPETRCEL